MATNKNNLLFVLSLLLAIWFALTAAAWVYLMNLVVSFPAGLLSLLFWYLGRKNDPKRERYRWIVVTWIIGIVLSLAALTYLLVFE